MLCSIMATINKGKSALRAIMKNREMDMKIDEAIQCHRSKEVARLSAIKLSASSGVRHFVKESHCQFPTWFFVVRDESNITGWLPGDWQMREHYTHVAKEG